jgi:hypothetical protein
MEMSKRWKLDVQPNVPLQGSYTIDLGLLCDPNGNRIDRVTSCTSLATFKAELTALKAELDQLLVEAEMTVKGLESALDQQAATGISTAEVWKSMEDAATEEEMASYFNSFDDHSRQEIAEFIFTHASMFKGRGPVFAERYNRMTHTLDA